VTCLSIDEIVKMILEYGLEEKVVSLAYGFGLIYIPVSMVHSFVANESSCNGTIAECLTTIDYFVRAHPPMSVKKYTIKQLEKYKNASMTICNWKCYVDCVDSQLIDIENAVDISEFYIKKGIKVTSSKGYCDEANDLDTQKKGCYEKLSA